MDKKEFMNDKRKEISRAFEGKSISGLFEPFPKDVEFKKRIDGCPFCGYEVSLFATENNLLMNGAWHIDCIGCDLSMREDFVLGREKSKAETVILKRWNGRKHIGRKDPCKGVIT